MIILDKPYVSPFLVDTIEKNNFTVLDNEISEQYFDKKRLTNTKTACELLSKDELLYTNSENSINWINVNLQNNDINRQIELSKNKLMFRNMLKDIYPDYYFKEILLSNIENVNPKEIKFPVILKPAIGFLSIGVYKIMNKDQWQNTIKVLLKDVKVIKNIFPKSVVNLEKFIIEEMISGDEFAVDAYFNGKSESVVLNIFKHPFFGDKDVADRVYYTSKNIVKDNYNKFKTLLDKIGKVGNFKDFPFHLELRVDNDNLIPIEINPMRFCGWCITDIAYYSWKINVYEYFLKNKQPNWQEILNNCDDSYYYFTMAEIPKNTRNKDIKDIIYSDYLKNISNPLDIRKIDYKNNPVFAIVFGKTNDLNEIKNLLALNMNDYIITN